MDEQTFDLEPWVAPAAALTLASMAIGLILPPFLGMGQPDPIGAGIYWLQTVGLCMGAVGFVAVVAMAFSRVVSPIETINEHLDSQRVLSLLVGGVLIAFNLTAFGLIKSELGLVGFAADPMLAAIDRQLLGGDAWRLFEWVRHPYLGEAYHIVWLAWLFLTLTLLLWQRASPRKTRLLIVYFLLWSLIGPLVHLAMPAAGPVLSAALTGSGFEGLAVVGSDAQKFNYLLEGYRTSTFNPGGGISAMPSLHIATMAWTVFFWRGSMRWLAIVITAYMWAGSVALGWHYLVDGAVGIVLVWAAFAVFAAMSRRGGPNAAAKLA